jgi:hypothetical protein
VCLNRFRNPTGRPRPDSGLLRHRKKRDTSLQNSKVHHGYTDVLEICVAMSHFIVVEIDNTEKTTFFVKVVYIFQEISHSQFCFSTSIPSSYSCIISRKPRSLLYVNIFLSHEILKVIFPLKNSTCVQFFTSQRTK